MAFTNLYTHLIWSTKYRRHQLTPSSRASTFAYMGKLITDLNAHPEVINGVEDHVHILARFPPTLCVAKMVQKVKSASSRWRNLNEGCQVLKWQTKYAAISVGPREVAMIRRYIEGQEAHHRKQTFKDELRGALDEQGIPYDERYMWE